MSSNKSSIVQQDPDAKFVAPTLKVLESLERNSTQKPKVGSRKPNPTMPLTVSNDSFDTIEMHSVEDKKGGPDLSVFKPNNTLESSE